MHSADGPPLPVQHPGLEMQGAPGQCIIGAPQAAEGGRDASTYLPMYTWLATSATATQPASVAVWLVIRNQLRAVPGTTANSSLQSTYTAINSNSVLHDVQ